MIPEVYVYATTRKRHFVVLRNSRYKNVYVVETVKKDYTTAKRQVRELYDATFESVTDALLAIEYWNWGNFLDRKYPPYRSFDV